MFASGGNELTSRCFLTEQRREEGKRGGVHCSGFPLLAPFPIGGERGKLQNTRIQKYRNGEIQELKEENAENRKREGLQCAGFPLLEAFPIRGRGGILLSL